MRSLSKFWESGFSVKFTAKSFVPKQQKHLSTFLTPTEETTLYHIIRQKVLLIIMIMIKKNLWRLGSGEYLEDFFCVKPLDIPVIGKEWSP